MPEQSDDEIPRDHAGAETLSVLASAPNYNSWQLERIAPYLGKRICEVGAGIGNMSELLCRRSPELLVLTDTDPYYLNQLTSKFSSFSNVSVEPLTLPDNERAQKLSRLRFDTVVALNVVEHIEEDFGAVRSMANLVVRGGRVIILVPALPKLYGSLDVELGHFRRYGRQRLRAMFFSADLQVEHLFYFNAIGAAGWWLNARVLKRRRISKWQIWVFDRLVPFLRTEDLLPTLRGQSLIAVGLKQ